MPTYIVKLDTPDGPRYLEYSTIVDAPTTYGVTLDEFRDYYLRAYGASSEWELEERLERVETKGTSSLRDVSAADTLTCNRAGKDDTEMTVLQIVDYYCVRQGRGAKPIGLVLRDDTEGDHAVDCTWQSGGECDCNWEGERPCRQ